MVPTSTLKLAIGKNKFYNIPNTRQHRDMLAQAKTAVAEAKPDKAIGILMAIEVESVKADTRLLSGRWAERMRNQIAGVLEPTDKSFQRINRDVNELVEALAAEMKAYGVVDEEVRQGLKRRYTNRLAQKLAKRQPINLRHAPSTDGTSEETAGAFVPISPEKVDAHVEELFRGAYGRLLITGKPGAGKTVLLLRLELALLASESDLLPLILNLSTWKKDYVTLDPWLREILPAELGATKKYAADLLQQNRLILLLDGLDEVEESEQAACLEAIGRYRADTNGQYVISSRTEDYKAIMKDAPVNLQIEVGDLTLEQMEAELMRMGHQQAGAMPLLNALKKHPALRQAAQVPFYFNTLHMLFAGGKTLSDLGLKGSTAQEIQDELTPQFVKYTLTLPADKPYSSQQAAHWLSFLAHNMTQRNQVVFELADLQYDWSPVRLSRVQSGLANIIGGLIGGLAGILVGGLVGSLAGSLVVVLVVGLSRVFNVLLVGALNFGLPEGLVVGLVVGLAVGLAVGLVVSLVYVSFEKLYPSIRTQEAIRWSWEIYFYRVIKYTLAGLVVGLVVGLVGGLVGGLVSLLVVGLSDYLQGDSIASIQLNHPYQRFSNSAKMLHFSILQHWHLMWLFSRKGWLPWKIVPFLHDMVTQHLLDCPDGATWRFRHRILQEHFAKIWGSSGEAQPTGAIHEADNKA